MLLVLETTNNKWASEHACG